MDTLFSPHPVTLMSYLFTEITRLRIARCTCTLSRGAACSTQAWVRTHGLQNGAALISIHTPERFLHDIIIALAPLFGHHITILIFGCGVRGRTPPRRSRPPERFCFPFDPCGRSRRPRTLRGTPSALPRSLFQKITCLVEGTRQPLVRPNIYKPLLVL